MLKLSAGSRRLSGSEFQVDGPATAKQLKSCCPTPKMLWFFLPQYMLVFVVIDRINAKMHVGLCDASEDRNCMLVTSDKPTVISNSTSPGQLFTPDEQCQQLYGSSSYYCAVSIGHTV